MLEARTEAPPTLRLAAGVELIGEYRDSGFQEPQYLVGRADGQIIQLPRLLYLVLADIDGKRTADEVAIMVSDQFGRSLTGEQITYLVDNKLRPAGLIAAADGEAQPRSVRPDPLLALRSRTTVVPAAAAWVIAGLFRPLFWRPVVIAALLALVAVDVAIVVLGGIAQLLPSVQTLVHEPIATLFVLVVVFVFGMFHECGHVTACRYGGARPGPMGIGIYLVWPAMYSTVTDAYRLDRTGRLRTDLGGIYFNVLFLIVAGAAYLVTGAPWLLITLVLLHVQTIWQFLPSLRLDGYYILSDLAGVPDLFSLLGPVLRSLIPGREPHPRVAELKPWTRRVITVWVLLAVPCLLYFFALLVFAMPRILPMVWDSLQVITAGVAEAIRTGQVAAATLGMIQVSLLILPWAGLVMIAAAFGRTLIGVLGRRHRPASAAGGTRTGPQPRAAAGRGWFITAAAGLALIAGIVLVRMGTRGATPGETALADSASAVAGLAMLPSWPDAVAVHQLAALQVLLSGYAPPVLPDIVRVAAIAAGLAGCLALWPVVRRCRVRPPAAALAVGLGGLVLLHGSIDPGGLAAAWLILAAATVGRGRTENAVAVVATVIGVLTAPLAAVALGAAGASALLAGASRPGVVRLLGGAVLAGAAAAVAVAATGDGPLVVTGAGPVPPTLLPVLLGAAAMLGAAWSRSRRLRPAAGAAGALVVCVAAPGPHATTALLLVAPILAVLAVVLLDRAFRKAPAPTPVPAPAATAPVPASAPAETGAAQ
ncbi:hypothetical protein [Pseudonocardia asaccharolytica]|uniref:hypothetical protein n=1 Tax=Pseudonocardia asaccharolytica TaxID=54010 RepID=UPI0004240FE7|nr:hypothetical protein [Pseudonocardia asaccharolytica]